MTAETMTNESAESAENNTTSEGAPAMSDNKSAELRYIAVTMTPELLSAIDKECAESGASRGGLLKQIVCSHFGIETTSAPRRAKYATKEEAAEAKKNQTATRNLKIKVLLKLHSLGGDKSKLSAEELAAIGE
jgi:hypothetical protein